MALLDALFRPFSFYLLPNARKQSKIIAEGLIANCLLHLGLCCLVSGWPLLSCEFSLHLSWGAPVGIFPADVKVGRAGKDDRALPTSSPLCSSSQQ